MLKRTKQNGVQNAMYLSLGQAARETGKSKSVISNALKSGRLSGRRNEKEEWEIDPAELFRVFPPQNGQQSGSERFSTPENPLIELLREQLRLAQEQIKQGYEREQQATEEKMRLLAMLEIEQTARRDMELKLLSAPTVRPGNARLWILLVLLLASIGAAVVYWQPWIR